MSWFFKLIGNSSGNGAEVDTNNNLKVNMPTTASQSGYVQNAYLANSSNTKTGQITEDGGYMNATHRPLLDLSFNSASGTWSPIIGTNATTLTKAVSNGFMRLNSGASTTTTTGISIYTTCVFNIKQGVELRIKMNVKHTNAAATNKQMEWGLGYYNFAAGQANAMNEFIGFRITAGGVLQGVLAYTTGGAPTESTVTINSGTPYTDGQAKEYEIRISNRKVEYWANGTLHNTIAIATDVYSVLKAVAYPFIARVFNSGAASAAPLLDIGSVTIFRLGADVDISFATINAIAGKASHYFVPDLLAGGGTNPFNFPGTGTAPTAATGSNTASVLNNSSQLGGFFRMNGASFNVAVHNNVLVTGYQNPSLPTANGAANNARNFICTGATIAPMVVSGALTGGPFTAIWFLTVGGTALSLATTDADGTTAVAQKAPRVITLGRTVSFGATAAAGVVETGQGDTSYFFETPLPVHPGEFICLGLRIITVTAVTAGTIDGAVYLNGYWE
jgi:hypothetical protein